MSEQHCPGCSERVVVAFMENGEPMRSLTPCPGLDQSAETERLKAELQLVTAPHESVGEIILALRATLAEREKHIARAENTITTLRMMVAEQRTTLATQAARLAALEGAARKVARYKGTRTYVGTMFDPLMEELLDALDGEEKR